MAIKCVVPQTYEKYDRLLNPDKKPKQLRGEVIEQQNVCSKSAGKACFICKLCVNHCLGHAQIRMGYGEAPVDG